jgi:hypothetical protein
MRRTRRDSFSRLAASFPVAARLARPLGSAALSVVVLLCAPGLAPADPGAAPETLGALIADVAAADQHLQDLGAAIQTEQESVNKALVDVETARDNAAATQHDVEVSQQAVRRADTAIAAAQQRFNAFAADTYVNGPSESYLTPPGPRTSSPRRPPARCLPLAPSG